MPHALVIGSSDGIGLALAESLLDDGWSVTGLSRSAGRLARERYTHRRVDVRDAGYAAYLSELATELGDLELCVYCVGVGEVLDVETLAAERAVFDANLIGAVVTAQVLIPRFIQARAGHFIGLSSQADRVVDGRAPSYGASKAGLSAYLEGLALACRSHGVFVTNVRFGFVDTKMAKADQRPFMISAPAAAAHVRRCMQRRPVRYTYPKRMALLLCAYRALLALRRWAL